MCHAIRHLLSILLPISVSGCVSLATACEHNLDLTKWSQIDTLPDDFLMQEAAWNEKKQLTGWSANGGTWYASGESTLANCKKTPKSPCPDEVTKFKKKGGLWVSELEEICVD